MTENSFVQAARLIRNSKYTVVFTGAGISVESGIPPFRGAGGLWEKYDPTFIEIDHFLENPKASWELIVKVFFSFLKIAQPNPAHYCLAELEKEGWVKAVITQNIDCLHQKAGSRCVYEFHGTTEKLLCLNCGKRFLSSEVDLAVLPPFCSSCRGLLKPDFVFFGEPIPEEVNRRSFQETEKADVMLVIGTTGEVMPAALLPRTAKTNGAMIIEINPEASVYTRDLTDIFLQGKAGKVMSRLKEAILNPRNS